MSQQYTPAVPQQQSKTSAPAHTSGPLPIDPSLLRHVGGGTDSNSTPTKGW